MNQFEDQQQPARLSRCSGLAFSAAACLLSCGCGLLHIPYSTTIPREPLRRVSVRAYETREPLRDAEVSVVLYKHDNWFEPIGRWGVSESPDDVREAAGIIDDDVCETWQAKDLGNGDFVVTTRTKCSWLMVWLPLPPVLGPCLYHTYDVVVIASAPGHKTIWFTNDAVLPCRPNPECGYRGGPLPNGEYVEQAEGVLRVYLPRAEHGMFRGKMNTE